MWNRRGHIQRRETFADKQSSGKYIVKGNQYKKGQSNLTLCLVLLPTSWTNRNPCFGLKHLDTGVANQAVETELEEPEWKTNESALASLLVCAGVANSVENAGHDPASTENARSDGELQASNEKGSNEAGLVLEVVAVTKLSAGALHNDLSKRCSRSKSLAEP